MYPAAADIIAPGTDQLAVYQQFHQAVARAQLAAWLPHGRHTIVDVSGPRGPGAELAAMAGHKVLRVTDASTVSRLDARGGMAGRAAGPGPGQEEGKPAGRSATTRPGVIVPLIADPSRLPFLRDGCADEVIAEDGALSTHLAAEAMIAEIARVLRPGGRVLACVDSLVLGMSVLAGQHRWANLVDLPHEEVVLVPWPDGTITRCYGPDQARELFTGAGLAVRSIQPRTMLSESVITHVLRQAPRSLPRLVRAELAASSDESLGTQLVISARKRR